MTASLCAYNEKMAALKAKYQQEINCEVTAAQKERNTIIAKEIYSILSTSGRSIVPTNWRA